MDTVLETHNIVKKYGKKTVINDISITINRGDIYGLIGKNGAGKTTFMRTVLNLAKQDSGTITFFENQNIEQAGIKIGSLIEEPGLFKNSTVYENLKRFSILYNTDYSKIDELLELVRLSNVGDKKAKKLSLGMRQRLGIAIALLGNPEFLVLDEPTNGLDPIGMNELRELFLKLNRERNITLFISSHHLDELAKIATRYGIIDNGVLIDTVESSVLKEKYSNTIILNVDNCNKAKEILSKIIPSEYIMIKDDVLEICNCKNEIHEISTMLVNNSIKIRSIYQKSMSIEDYFIEKIGGKS